MDTKQIQEIKQVLEGFRTLAEATQYKITPPDALRLKAGRVYKTRRSEIAAALEATTAGAEDVGVFLGDYRGALLGCYDFKATQEQMHKALELRMVEAYQLGRFDFFTPLYAQYSQQVASWNLYTMMMRTESKPEGRRLYLESAPEAFQVCYLSRWITEPGRLLPEDFDGVTPAELSRALTMTRDTRAALDYFTYVLVAKYGLNATQEELESVTAPDLSAFDLGESPLEWAVSQADTIAARMEARGESGGYFRTLPKKEREAAAARVADTTPEPMRRKQLNLGSFGKMAFSAPLEDVKGRPPLVRNDEGRELTTMAFTNELRKSFPERKDLSDIAVARGLDMLSVMIEPEVRKYLGCVEDWENGVFIFKDLNITKLAEYAGYKGAREDVREGLRVFLDSLSGVRLVRPLNPSHKRKRDRRRKKEARADIIRPFWLKRHADDWSNFDLWVAVDLMYNDETPVYIDGKVKALLREISDGSAAQERFNAQLFRKPYILEDELLDCVFGYSYELRELTEREDELREAAEVALHELPDLEKKCKRMKDADRFDTVRAAWLEMTEDDGRKQKAFEAVRALSKVCECLDDIKKKKRAQGREKSRDRKLLEKWFALYKENGVLLMEWTTLNAKGEKVRQWLTTNPKDLPEFQEQPKGGAEVSTS